MLEEAGLIEQREGRLELTPRGVRALGQRALADLYRKLMKDKAGRHDVERVGIGNERTYEHKPYEFGDPFHLNVEQTLKNAIWRSGAGTPVRLTPEDFEVERTEVVTRSATVLLLDVSLSMPMRGNFLPAKKVAMALHSLITTQFPRDFFGLVSFGRVRARGEAGAPARDELGLRLGHEHAARDAAGPPDARPRDRHEADHHGHRRRAHCPHRGGETRCSPTRRLRPRSEETLREVARCTKDGIRINTFMLDESYYLRDFVEQMMRVNRGRAFFTTPDTLGDYVLVDFLEHKRVNRAS